MPRRAKGPRLYLRENRIDSRTGRALPDVYVIRDGGFEGSTGVGPERVGEAEQALADYITQKHAGKKARTKLDRTPRDPVDVSVARVLAFYLDDRAPHLASDQASVKASFSHLLDWWEDKSCADVIRSKCKEYVAHRTSQPILSYKLDPARAPRVSDQTARRELEDLKAAIGHWNGEYPFTTLPKVWLPEKREGNRDALTRAEAARLLKASMGWAVDPATGGWTRNRTSKANRRHLRRFILICLYTGTRHSAVRSLLWQESATNAWVDMETAIIYRRGKDQKDHRTKRRPVVKIPPRLLAHLRRWRRLDASRAEELRKRDPDAALNSVLHFSDQPLAGKIRTAFEGAVRDAGLPEEISPHWLRHTAATWLMQAGVDRWLAAGFLGMSVTVLEKHYGHHQPDYQDGASRSGRRQGISGKLSGL